MTHIPEYGIVKEGGNDGQISFSFGKDGGRNKTDGDGDILSPGPVSMFWRKGEKPIKRETSAELEGRVDITQTGTFSTGIETVNSAEDAAHILAPLRKSGVEKFHVLALDENKKPIGILDVSMGSINTAIVDPRDSIGRVLDFPGVKSVWLAHNHPSGVSLPSREDIGITERLGGLAEGAGIEVSGHQELAINIKPL